MIARVVPCRALAWVPVAAFVTSHVCSIGNVTGGSMSPTFNGPYAQASMARSQSDVVLLNRWAAATHYYRVGDVVTLYSPLDPSLLLTKRIVALAGDVVRVWAPDRTARSGSWQRIKVPSGHAWVEGDARVDIVPNSLASAAGKSRDSREFGPVPLGLITSRIDCILWPPKRFGPPKPRPKVQAAGGEFPPSQTETQVHASLARMLDSMEGAAHPADSRLTPYKDWHEEQPSRPNPRSSDESTRAHWNKLSRGGRLGDDSAE